MGTMSLMDVGSFTIEDLYAYREQREDMTIQLIEGEFIVSPSPAWVHQVVHSNLFALIARLAPEECRVISAPMDLRAGERSMIQPDLMVIDATLSFDKSVTVPPLLAIEILSPHSQRTDLVRKPEVLAKFGCAHYWVVDPLRPAVREFHLVSDLYVTRDDVEGDDEFSTDAPFPVSFRPNDLTR